MPTTKPKPLSPVTFVCFYRTASLQLQHFWPQNNRDDDLQICFFGEFLSSPASASISLLVFIGKHLNFRYVAAGRHFGPTPFVLLIFSSNSHFAVFRVLQIGPETDIIFEFSTSRKCVDAPMAVGFPVFVVRSLAFPEPQLVARSQIGIINNDNGAETLLCTGLVVAAFELHEK